MTIREEQDALVAFLSGHSAGATIAELRAVLPQQQDFNIRTRLKALVEEGRVRREGAKRGTRYFAAQHTTRPPAAPALNSPAPADERPDEIPMSAASQALRTALAHHYTLRPIVGYDRDFLRDYLPNRSAYLDAANLQQLRALGQTHDASALPGTYARRKHIYERLLIDLSWSSSYLEGSTLTRLDTERLMRELEQDSFAQTSEEALYRTITLNHKYAIDLLLGQEPSQLALSSDLIKSIHGQLSGGLLPPIESGHLRRADVVISGSSYQPLNEIAALGAEFESTVRVAQEIVDPFEQSIFLLIHLPYLQPFQDVNKRTSRIISNLPLLVHNLCPISFVGVSRELYTDAVLGIYERRDVSLMVDLYMWSYERSAQLFGAASLSTQDFMQRTRLKYAELLRPVLRTLIKEVVDISTASDDTLRAIIQAQLERRDLVLNSASQDDLIAVIRHDAPQLHPGTIAYYGVTATELTRWLNAQTSSPLTP